MTSRNRKLVGTIALLMFVSIYALLAMVAAMILQVNASKATELTYYLVTGLLWVLPASWLVKWMQQS
jgi:hypothetical protein